MHLSTAALAALAAVAAPRVSSQSTLATVLSERNDLVSFNKLLDASGFAADLFRGVGLDATVFAPNDAAFISFPAGQFSWLMDSEWAEHVACFIEYHTAEGTYPSTSLQDGMNLTTLHGETLNISLSPTRVNGASVVEADIIASNGVAYTIDTVLSPPCISQTVVDWLQANDDYSILRDFVEQAGLTDMLASSSPITLFAPPNAAWVARGDRFLENLSASENGDFLEAFILNHVLSGNWYASRLVSAKSFTLDTVLKTTAFFYNQSETKFVNNAKITDSDTLAFNGVIHSVDDVVILAALGDILLNAQVVSDSISFSNFTAALMQANFFDPLFLDSLNNPRTFTVFAPGDDAFANVPKEELDKLLSPTWSFHLRELLRYHVVDSTLRSDSLMELDTLNTFADSNLTITLQANQLKIDGANVIYPDLAAYNGVIHGIDEVLFPRNLTLTIREQLEADPQWSTFFGYLNSFGLFGALEENGPATVFVPTNEAFDMMGDLSAQFDDSAIETILQYHLVDANVFLNELADGAMITTLNGENVTVSVVNSTEDVRTLNDAQVIDGGLASNGVIFVLNKVLRPDLPTFAPSSSASPTEEGYVAPTEPPAVGPTAAPAVLLSSGAVQRLGSKLAYWVALLCFLYYVDQ